MSNPCYRRFLRKSPKLQMNARLQGSARDLSQRPPGLAIGGVGTERRSCARLRGNCSLARGSGEECPGKVGALSVVSIEASQMVCIGGDCELLHPVTNGLLSPSFRISARFEEAAPDLRSEIWNNHQLLSFEWKTCQLADMGFGEKSRLNSSSAVPSSRLSSVR